MYCTAYLNKIGKSVLLQNNINECLLKACRKPDPAQFCARRISTRQAVGRQGLAWLDLHPVLSAQYIRKVCQVEKCAP